MKVKPVTGTQYIKIFYELKCFKNTYFFKNINEIKI